jgi:hypothetical protein
MQISVVVFVTSRNANTNQGAGQEILTKFGGVWSRNLDKNAFTTPKLALAREPEVDVYKTETLSINTHLGTAIISGICDIAS